MGLKELLGGVDAHYTRWPKSRVPLVDLRSNSKQYRKVVLNCSELPTGPLSRLQKLKWCDSISSFDSLTRATPPSCRPAVYSRAIGQTVHELTSTNERTPNTKIKRCHPPFMLTIQALIWLDNKIIFNSNTVQKVASTLRVPSAVP